MRVKKLFGSVNPVLKYFANLSVKGDTHPVKSVALITSGESTHSRKAGKHTRSYSLCTHMRVPV